MAVDLQKLRDAVARNRTVDTSAAELIRGIAQRIRDAVAADDIEDATNINALADELEASNTDLSTAVSENTPSGGSTPAPQPEG